MFADMRLRSLTLGIIIILLFATLTGCAQEKEIPAEPPQVGAEPTEEPSEPAAPAIEEETRIIIVIPEDPPGFNALVTDTGYDQLVAELVMLGLVEIDPYGEFYPELAVEIPTIENGGVVLNEDAWTMDVTWKLREDVFWADGRPVTVDDVLFTWNAISDPETGIWAEGIDYTDSLDKVDDYTFVAHYNTVYPNYRVQFGGENFVVWPAHHCDADQGFTAWDCNRNPLSNGPYILEEWAAGDHLSFVRNPNYFQTGKPYIDRIVVRIVPEQSVRKTMLLQGDADVSMWITEAIAEDLKGAANVRLTFSPSDRWVLRLFPNQAARGTVDAEATPHPIFADVRVRQAMRMAIDVDTIAKEIFLGYSDPVWTEFFRPPYVCDNIPRPTFDPEGARALLEEAGWIDQDGDGVRECHGCLNADEGYKMEAELMIYAEYGQELELAQQLIAEMLKTIGFDLELSMVEGGIMWADAGSGGIEQNGNFDLNLWDDGYPGIDPTDHLWYYYYSSAATPDNGWNIVRWQNDELDALLDEAYTLDEDYRQEVFCQIAELLDSQVPQILLFSTFDADAYSSRIEGVQATVNDIVTWNVADWRIVDQ